MGDTQDVNEHAHAKSLQSNDYLKKLTINDSHFNNDSSFESRVQNISPLNLTKISNETSTPLLKNEVEDYTEFKNKIRPHKKLVYVCITGQLSRLELRNKINNLFIPLHKMGFKLFVGLAMTTEKAHYVNNNNGDKMRLYTSISRVKDALMNVSGVVGVTYFSEVNKQQPDIFMNEFYQKSLKYVNTTKRVRLNARQFRQLQYCDYPEITNQTSMFIRVREDTFIDRIDLQPIVLKALRGHVVTTKCEAWRGINDKIAFGPSDRASDFFRLPFQTYLNFKTVIENFNPEQMYKYTYLNNGFSLKPTSKYVVTKAITTVNTTLSGSTVDGKMCIISGNKFRSISRMCPERGISGIYNYTAECWP